MAKSSKIEPINIELYEKAWTHSGRGVQVVEKSPCSTIDEQKKEQGS